MLTVIIVIIVLYILYRIYVALINTDKGAYLLILLPLMLLVANFTIVWENYWHGIPVPNPVQPEGFLYDIIAMMIGGNIDKLFGIEFFQPALAWILGLTFYGIIFFGIQWFFITNFIDNFPFEKGIYIFIGWLVFFTAFYYFRAFDFLLVFKWFSMPYEVNTNVKIYYWIGIAFSIYKYVREGLNQ